MTAFACPFSQRYIWGVADPYGLTLSYGPLSGTQECNFSLATPPSTPVDGTNVVTFYRSGIYDVINTTKQTAYSTFKTSIGDELQNEMKQRGWAGMGMWFHRISEIAAMAGSMATLPITITEGTIAIGAGNVSDAACADASAGQDAKVKCVINRYKAWWQTAIPGAAVMESDPGRTLQAPIPDGGGDASKATGMVSDVLGKYTFSSWIGVSGTDLYPMARLANLGNALVAIAIDMWTLETALMLASATLGIEALGNGDPVLPIAIIFSPLAGMLTSLVGILFGAGVLLAYWIPILPMIRVAFAVLTWMIAVFEAVVMVPIAALTHISTEGEGMGGQVRNVWILWLNVFLRPILTVLGYVGAMLVFNTFIAYISDAFGTTLAGQGMQAGQKAVSGGIQGVQKQQSDKAAGDLEAERHQQMIDALGKR
ncbi:MAG: DotA/TraY family protein [Proteobacteria bacterium]|nr:DotA/TraY family protein [Pseudomonadota bacterium]